MSNHQNRSKKSAVVTAVAEFFGRARVCYVDTQCDNFAANFYGDTRKLTRRDVIGCIETARDNWDWADDIAADLKATPQSLAIDAILSDLTFIRPLGRS